MINFKSAVLLLCAFAGNDMLSIGQQLPIKATRTISFTTTEGSYMNVDVSPDGKTLAFDMLGNLYTVPVKGGTAKQITRGMAVNFCPVWSPDGQRLAYISDQSGARHLWIRDVAGTFAEPLGLSDEQIQGEFLYGPTIMPLWTHDGNYVFFDHSFYGVNGNKLPAPKIVGRAVAFSRETDTIFHVDAEAKRLYSFCGKTDSNSILLYGLEKCRNAALSPDRRWWIYIADSVGTWRLIRQEVSSARRKILVSSLFEHAFEGSVDLSWKFNFECSPDSRYVYIGFRGKLHRISILDGYDQLIPFTADVKVDIGPLNYQTFRVSLKPSKVRYTRYANASPDGRHLVFSALNKIYIMDLPHGKSHKLTNQPFNQYQPMFSPDSKWVSYTSWSDTAGGQVWRVRIIGGKPQQLSDTAAEYFYPTWSPDGKSIAVIKGAIEKEYKGSAVGKLQLIDVNTRKTHTLLDSVAIMNQLSFSADGKKIIYHADSLKGDGRLQPEFSEIATDGKNKKDITVGGLKGVSSYGSANSEGVISPDRQYLVYCDNENIYVVPLVQPHQSAVIVRESQNMQPIRVGNGLDPHWEQRGKVLSWSYGNRFYRIQMRKFVKAAEHPENGHIAQNKNIGEFIQPDQIINLELTTEADYGHGTVALTNARVLTMKGRQIIKNGTLIIKNGRFVSVGTSGQVIIPTFAKVIDLTGKTIIPGLVDIHDHMHYNDRNIEIPEQQSRKSLINLAYGVTTARDPANGPEYFRYSEALNTGLMVGPRLYPSGAVMNVDHLGHPLYNFEEGLNLAIQRKLLGGTFLKQYLLNTRLEREWLLMAAEKTQLNMTNEGGVSIQEYIGQLKDGSSGVEHNPFDWPDAYSDIITLFAKSGTYFTPTLQVRPGASGYLNENYWRIPSAKQIIFTSAKSLRNPGPPKNIGTEKFLYAAQLDATIRKAGGKVALGGHGNDPGTGSQNELWALQMGGLTNMEALQAGTIIGAEAIGIQKDVGSIEVGKIADLIILNSNPLDDIHNSRDIKYVMKSGILYDGDTLDELWPVKKKLPAWRLDLKDNNESSSQKSQPGSDKFHGDDDDE